MRKPLGVVAGNSLFSTILYYKFLVEAYRERTGVDPTIVIYSIPSQALEEALNHAGKRGAERILSQILDRLDAIGVRFVLLAGDVLHTLIGREVLVKSNVLELIDVREAVWRKIEDLGVDRIGLLAEQATSSLKLYQDYLGERGYTVILPGPGGQKRLDTLIERLRKGVFPSSSKLVLATLVSELTSKGAEVILYGSVEPSMLIGRVRLNRPVVDSLTEHVLYAVNKMLSYENQL